MSEDAVASVYKRARSRPPSIPNGDMHLDMGRGIWGTEAMHRRWRMHAPIVLGPSAIHRSVYSSHGFSSFSWAKINPSWANVNNFFLNSSRILEMDTYSSYVEQSAEVDPRLQSVFGYLERRHLHERCQNCTFLDGTLVNFELGAQPSRRLPGQVTFQAPV
ncbi:hypothetical protein CLCR_03732 [Cladophialophora carrionii]|uniref:Uncharacterized protein n=1 Tax=Cladophialophora carrionii TaxID=86049 RepID=A0A1C1CH02_9EURO|nr:hypothetical protein CLCR_03732 [Cladophialophora carrionii]